MPTDPDPVLIVQAVLTTVFGGDRDAMARETGFDASSISRFVRGVRPPSAKFLDRLARLPEVDPAFVRDGIGEPIRKSSIGRRDEYAVPIAKAPLPRSPDRCATLFTPESVEVPPSVFSPSTYAVRAINAVAEERFVVERLLSEDAIVFETDRQAVRSILDRSPHALKVYARRSEKLWETSVARKPPDLPREATTFERQIELPGTPARVRRRETVHRSVYRVVGVATYVFRNL